jgi:hypothetical protein
MVLKKNYFNNLVITFLLVVIWDHANIGTRCQI